MNPSETKAVRCRSARLRGFALALLAFAWSGALAAGAWPEAPPRPRTPLGSDRPRAEQLATASDYRYAAGLYHALAVGIASGESESATLTVTRHSVAVELGNQINVDGFSTSGFKVSQALDEICIFRSNKLLHE